MKQISQNICIYDKLEKKCTKFELGTMDSNSLPRNSPSSGSPIVLELGAAEIGGRINRSRGQILFFPSPSALSFPLFDARSRAFGFDTLEPLIKQSLAPRFPSRVIKESSHVEQTSQPRYIFFRGPSRPSLDSFFSLSRACLPQPATGSSQLGLDKFAV